MSSLLHYQKVHCTNTEHVNYIEISMTLAELKYGLILYIIQIDLAEIENRVLLHCTHYSY